MILIERIIESLNIIARISRRLKDQKKNKLETAIVVNADSMDRPGNVYKYINNPFRVD